MISLRYFYLIVKLLRNLRYQKFLETFEIKALLLPIKVEKPFPIAAIKYHILRRQSTELHDFENLVIVVLSRKNRRFNE